MNRKSLGKIFKFVFMTLFVTFIALYISGSTGYFEYQTRKQVALTEKQIKEFEKDVKEGKKVDATKYLEVNQKNYQNKLSGTGLKISETMKKGVNKIVDVSFKFLSNLAG